MPIAALLSFAAMAQTAPSSSVPAFWVRPGYHVELVAENLGEARFIEFDDKGTLYLSRPNRGDILTLRKKGSKYETVGTFVSKMQSVHGLHFANGWLWFTQSGAVYRGRDTNGDGVADEVVTVLKDLPSGGHWWRSIYVVKDGFFTSIGDSGNINDETESDRQKIWKYSLDGLTRTLFASGLRNTEKLRYRPGTTDLYGADHGSDNFGGPLKERAGRNQPVTDFNPPCEFNKYVPGGFYGHPFITGNRVPRIEFQNRPDILEWAGKTIAPAWCFGGHWAPNGFTFVSKKKLGDDFVGDALVALHGSWNSTKPVGYRVERVMFDPATGNPYGAQMLVGTIDATGNVVGRPVDVAEEPDGGILFTDDQTNRIYRIVKGK